MRPSFYFFSLEFRVVGSAATSTERGLNPGVEAVTGVVRRAVNDLHLNLMPTLPGFCSHRVEAVRNVGYHLFGFPYSSEKTLAING